MQISRVDIAVGAAVDDTKYVEMPASYRLIGATVTQAGTSVGAHSSNYKILTLKDNGGNTIATVNSVAGWVKGTVTAFTMSGPEYAVLTAGQRYEIAATHAGSGAAIDCSVTLELAAARG